MTCKKQIPAIIIEGIFCGITICANVDKSVKMFPSSVFTPLVLGTLSCCSSAIIGGAIRIALGSKETHELVRPSWVSKTALFSTIVYYGLKYRSSIKFEPIFLAGSTTPFPLSHDMIIYSIWVAVFLNVTIMSWFASPASSSTATTVSTEKKSAKSVAAPVQEEEDYEEHYEEQQPKPKKNSSRNHVDSSLTEVKKRR